MIPAARFEWKDPRSSTHVKSDSRWHLNAVQVARAYSFAKQAVWGGYPEAARSTVQGSSFGRPCIACTESSVLVLVPHTLLPVKGMVCQVFKLLFVASCLFLPSGCLCDSPS
ncbi:hypothetical protein J3E69DRAFT_341887 [Trichoderma sp. SZMC 28015]